MRVPYQDCFHLIEPLLAKVEKPSRYIDHEWGTLSKADADYRCCLIYPDVYEVGLPNQGIAILYNILNQAEGISCERGYVPWPDMGDAMREAGIPLLSLEGAAPVASFDIVGLHVPHEMAVTNFLEALDLAGIPLLAADRGEDDPIIIAGGPSVYNPEPYAAFFDAILIGEGGSGGALALAAGDRVWMLENAVYSVISPEGCATILWKDAAKAEQAAEELKLTADDALALGVVESVIPEAGLGEPEFYDALAQRLMREVDALSAMPVNQLLAARYARFRRFGGEAQA